MISVSSCVLGTADRRCRSARLLWPLLPYVLLLCFLAGSLAVRPVRGQGLAPGSQPVKQPASTQQLAHEQRAASGQRLVSGRKVTAEQGPELKSALLSGALSPRVHPVGARDTTGAVASRKNPTAAVLLSLGGTVLLAPVYGAGLVVGPSFGHFYAGNSAQAWKGTLTRAGGTLAVLFGSGLALGAAFKPGQQKAQEVLGKALIGVGVGGVVVSAIYDIADADNSARQHNRAHGLQAVGRQMQVAPTVGGPRGKQIGLVLRAQF